MRLFGYAVDDDDEREAPHTLREASVLATADELRAIADFFRWCADEIDHHGARFEHEHLCAFLRTTPLASITDDADLIVVRAAS